MQRHAFNLYGLRHLVARSASYGRNNGKLRAGQRIEQRAFACIGLPCNHHADAFAQQSALACLLADGLQLLFNALQLPSSIGLLQKGHSRLLRRLLNFINRRSFIAMRSPWTCRIWEIVTALPSHTRHR